MRRHRKGDYWRPPTAGESAAHADTAEAFRRHPAQPQNRLTRGSGIYVKTPVGGIAARDGETIYSAECKRCVETSTAVEKTILETDEELLVYNFDLFAIPGDSFIKTALMATGTRFALLGDVLVRYCTKDAHPGMGVVFEAYAPGVWDPSTSPPKYEFTCDAEHTVKIIDWDYGVPTPGAGARGWARWENSDDHGRILVVVTMDCDTRGVCCS